MIAANALRAARHEHNLILELKVHGETQSGSWTGILSRTTSLAAKSQETSVDWVVGPSNE